MADTAIPDLTAAAALTGAELAHVIQGGNSRRAALSAIAALTTGTAWQLLGGAYTTPGVWLHSADGDVAAANFTGLAGAIDIMLLVRLVTRSVSGINAMHLSVDNGSSYFTSSGDYIAISTAGVESANVGLSIHITDATAARSSVGMVYAANLNGIPKRCDTPNRAGGDQTKYFVGSTSPVNAVRISPTNGGNLTGGEIYCLVRK